MRICLKGFTVSNQSRLVFFSQKPDKSAALSRQLKNFQKNSQLATLNEEEKDSLAAPQRFPTHKPTAILKEDEPKAKVNLGLTEAVKLETKGYDVLNSINETTDHYQFKAKIAESIDTFHKALSAQPHELQLPHIYHGLALCYTRLTDWNKVIEYNEIALDCDPDFVPSYESLGEAYQMQKEFKLALGWYTKFYDTFVEYYSAIDHETKNAKSSGEILGQVLYKRGICYFEIYDYEMAAGDFNTCVEVESKFAYSALNWLGRIATENGEHWDCISLNTKCLERNPKCLAAYYDRSNAYDMVGKKKEAEEDMKKFNYIKREVIWKRKDQLLEEKNEPTNLNPNLLKSKDKPENINLLSGRE